MLDTIGRYLQTIANVQDAYALTRVLDALGDRYSSQALNSAGLVINAAGALFPKTGVADFYAVAGGVLVRIAAGTALAGAGGVNLTAGSFGVALYFVDSAGTVTVAPGTPGTTVSTLGWPQFPQKKALVGLLLLTCASPFVGGTTPLDTATTVYLSPVGAFDPTVLL